MVHVDQVLLGLRVPTSVLLRLRRLHQVLLLALTAAAATTAGVGQLLVQGRVLIGVALVRCIGIGVVSCLLMGRARARTAQVITDDRRRCVCIDRVLLAFASASASCLVLPIWMTFCSWPLPPQPDQHLLPPPDCLAVAS